MALPPGYSSIYNKLDCDIWCLWGGAMSSSGNAIALVSNGAVARSKGGLFFQLTRYRISTTDAAHIVHMLIWTVDLGQVIHLRYKTKQKIKSVTEIHNLCWHLLFVYLSGSWIHNQQYRDKTWDMTDCGMFCKTYILNLKSCNFINIEWVYVASLNSTIAYFIA